MIEHDCNDCENYDVCEGVCKLTGENHHGYDDACVMFEIETDMTTEELERWNN